MHDRQFSARPPAAVYSVTSHSSVCIMVAAGKGRHQKVERTGDLISVSTPPGPL